jgi:hypothetical protein
MNETLSTEVKNHWKQLRGMTYDFIDEIKEDNLSLRLPFPKSQTLRYQFRCMTGAQESNIPLISNGLWNGFSCSLDEREEITKSVIVSHMRKADKDLMRVIQKVDLLTEFKDATVPSNTTPIMNYMILVEHESHHQGQIINFIYAHDLPIPESWKQKWDLSK